MNPVKEAPIPGLPDLELGAVPANNENNNENTDNSPRNPPALCCGVLTCFAISIACIVVSLEYNMAGENEIVVLEGAPMFAFLFGACILFCFLVCITGSACIHCCDVCLVMHH